MVVRSSRPKGVISAPFGLGVLGLVLVPNQIGYQDVTSLLARQPAVSAHWRQHMRASAFGTIHAATFSFSRPIGTAMPQPLSVRLASLDPRSLMRDPEALAGEPPLEFPTVNRSTKGDRLISSQPEPPARSEPQAEMLEPAAAADALPELQSPSATASEPEGVAPEPKPDMETASIDANPDALGVDVPDPVESNPFATADMPVTADETVEPVAEMARLYFGNEPLGPELGEMEKWAPGEEPTILHPVLPADPDIKLSALNPEPPASETAKAPPEPAGESVAPKGEVTGEGKRPLTPAERLGLDGKDRTKAEKCLANAVYFEARGEPVRGQIAVAQVVMNRVFSGFYPRNVCAAVYQNAHRRLACQFTFACDGIPDVVTEPQAWVRATRIAKDVLDGKYWVPEVNRATHYHAYWVRPSWVREMRRLYKFGVHTFYRPRAWGDGADAPSWGSAAATMEATAKL